jgi:hypothetical protein
MKAAQKLLGAPTNGRGSARAGGGGGGSSRRQKSPQPAQRHKNCAKNGQFHKIFGLKISEKAIFCSKVLYKKYSPDVF